MSLGDLKRKIEAREALLGVIGLGYVGFPVACEFARVGFDVVGVELQVERVDKINAGLSPIEGHEPGLDELASQVVASGRLRATTDYQALRDRDVILVCVETPINADHTPQYRALRSALCGLGAVLRKGALVSIESTLAPGTMVRLVSPVLEQVSGMKVNQDFYLGTCPERVMPGKLLSNIRTVSRVIGGMGPQTAEVMRVLYSQIVQADLDVVDCLTAELVKTVENAYRDVQIAFANEVALICEALGGDVWKVRELVNKSPGRMMLFPGAGVGGHCIPKDPWLLVYSVRQADIPVRLIPAARAVNDSMPYHVLRLVRTALQSVGGAISESRILVLGYAYLENSGDTRNSPSEVLVSQLKALGAEVVIHDPYVPAYRGQLLDMAVGCDVAVAMVRHQEYCSLDLLALRERMRTPLLIDGRAVYTRSQVEESGFQYWGIGIQNGPVL